MEDATTRRAALLLEHNRPAEAEKELRAYLARSPHDVRALMLLSHSLTVQDKDREAVEVARQAVGIAPDHDATHNQLARALFGQRDVKGARASAEEAVRLDPGDANNYGLLALILHHLNEHALALGIAEQGLSIDPEHLGCLNIRSAELAHMKRFAEADSSMEKALELDPENPYTHSNTGWALLRRGEHARAMEHFREALRREPGMESARSGMIEALKARYWVYRQWLKYVFWVGNLKPGTQRMFIFGAWLLSRVLRFAADAVPTLRMLVWPLLVAYALFAMSTWVIEPLTNLLLRFNRFGRFTLNREEKLTSTLTGVSLAIALGSGLALAITGDERYLAPGIFGLLMMIPVASMFRASSQGARTSRILGAATLAILGALGSVLAFLGSGVFNFPLLAFLIGAIVYQWVVALLWR